MPQKKHLIPSVVHIDNTCRVQTLSKNFNPHFYNLIYEFYKLTDIPLLLNTSFNKAGEPIVQNEFDAIQSLITTDLDLLVIDNLIISK
jgi:carbamoyltransferase